MGIIGLGISIMSLVLVLILIIHLIILENSDEFYFLSDAPTVDSPVISSREGEFKTLFNTIDVDESETLQLEEMENYFLHRFLTYSSSTKNATLLLDANGKKALTPEETFITSEFLLSLDVNKDEELTENELTLDNITILFNKAKELHKSYDVDADGLITWEEFYTDS